MRLYVATQKICLSPMTLCSQLTTPCLKSNSNRLPLSWPVFQKFVFLLSCYILLHLVTLDSHCQRPCQCPESCVSSVSSVSSSVSFGRPEQTGAPETHQGLTQAGPCKPRCSLFNRFLSRDITRPEFVSTEPLADSGPVEVPWLKDVTFRVRKKQCLALEETKTKHDMILSSTESHRVHVHFPRPGKRIEAAGQSRVAAMGQTGTGVEAAVNPLEPVTHSDTSIPDCRSPVSASVKKVAEVGLFLQLTCH